MPVGELSAAAGDGAYRFVVEACRLAREGLVDGIVTAPLNKAAMQAGGHKWPGHTELLAHEFGVRQLQPRALGRRPVLLPPHRPRLPAAGHRGLHARAGRRHLHLAGAFVGALGKPDEAIGVAGLNPHAGENRIFGDEDADMLEPAVARARERGINAHGPIPADALIPAAVRGKWNIVVACYHDQGHAPFKAVYGNDGVNITIGLPVVRVSVDHGTAFDIAGKGIAGEGSLVLSCERAAALAPGWDAVWQAAAVTDPATTRRPAIRTKAAPWIMTPAPHFPPVRVEPDARRRIREALAGAGRRIVVFDDDPTGSQTVHDVAVVTVFDPEEIAAGLDGPGSTCFILTNTRSMDEADAVALNTRVGRTVFELSRRLDAPVEVISRSDSTLRGHVIAEVAALDAVRRDVLGRGFDGVLLIPAFLEAGRFTAGDVHWARVGGEPTPVGDTEFARDATFGFTASDLREFVAEKSGGTITPDQVHSLTLDDIRRGGPQRVAEILAGVTDGAFVVVNAVDYADLDVVVLGLLEPQWPARRSCTGPARRSRSRWPGWTPNPAQASDIWPDGRPGGHGLVVVGSHVGLTSRQVAVAQERGGIVEVELDVPAVADPARAGRPRRRGHRPGGRRAGRVGCVAVHQPHPAARHRPRRQPGDRPAGVHRGDHRRPRRRRRAGPAWVVAKGGITSHDVAVRGLGIRRATVLGQLLPGLVSVFQPVEALPEVVGVPYVVFAGNVGDENTLAYVIDLFSGRTSP